MNQSLVELTPNHLEVLLNLVNGTHALKEVCMCTIKVVDGQNTLLLYLSSPQKTQASPPFLTATIEHAKHGAKPYVATRFHESVLRSETLQYQVLDYLKRINTSLAEEYRFPLPRIEKKQTKNSTVYY